MLPFFASRREKATQLRMRTEATGANTERYSVLQCNHEGSLRETPTAMETHNSIEIPNARDTISIW